MYKLCSLEPAPATEFLTASLFPGSSLFRLIAQHERKPGSTLQPVCLSGFNAIKPHSIIKSKQSKHRQEETHTYTSSPAQTEWIIILERIPSIGGIKESQSINGTAWIG